MKDWGQERVLRIQAIINDEFWQIHWDTKRAAERVLNVMRDIDIEQEEDYYNRGAERTLAYQDEGHENS